MLNYIRAELYKAVHRAYLWIILIVLLAGECLLIWINHLNVLEGANINFFSTIELVPRMLTLGVFAAHLTADIIFAGQYKNGTMKNEVSFGLSRARIYFGKLISMAILSIALLLIAMVFYTGACWVFFDHTNGTLAALQYLGLSLLGALPIWLGMQALICAFSFLFASGIAAELSALGLYFGPSFIIANIVILMMQGGNEAVILTLAKVVPWLPVEILESVYTVATPNWDTLSLANIQWSLMGYCWIVGAFWMIVPTALGLHFFRKKEVK